ncbi:hypothetical protein PIB30_052134 [Stylosanthes scabra]|uniref:Uncharacterized protein n=1 Tax=Stylosanthes scabra TaxID=79078 RepID=A0ABU6WI31_9FABA|nr:hypothetical protein [Stylosanthes scabra]
MLATFYKSSILKGNIVQANGTKTLTMNRVPTTTFHPTKIPFTINKSFNQFRVHESGVRVNERASHSDRASEAVTVNGDGENREVGLVRLWREAVKVTASNGQRRWSKREWEEGCHERPN